MIISLVVSTQLKNSTYSGWTIFAGIKTKKNMGAAEKVQDMVKLQFSIHWHQNPYHKLKNIVSLFISLDFLGLVILSTHLLSKSFSSHLCPASMWQLVPYAQCRMSHSACFPASNDQSPAVFFLRSFSDRGNVSFSLKSCKVAKTTYKSSYNLYMEL